MYCLFVCVCTHTQTHTHTHTRTHTHTHTHTRFHTFQISHTHFHALPGTLCKCSLYPKCIQTIKKLCVPQITNHLHHYAGQSKRSCILYHVKASTWLIGAAMTSVCECALLRPAAISCFEETLDIQAHIHTHAHEQNGNPSGERYELPCRSEWALQASLRKFGPQFWASRRIRLDAYNRHFDS